MGDTTSRTFDMLGLLQQHGFVASERLATSLGVTTRTIRRDIARLRDLGYPIDTRLGVDGGYSLEPGAVLPPIFLSCDEALACALALRARNDGADQTLATSALQKILTSLPTRARWVIEAVARVAVDAPIDGLELTGKHPVDLSILGELARSCVLRREVRFVHTKHNGQSTTRRVDPHSLVNTVGSWYLVGFDSDASAWRTFRVDRVSEVDVTAAPSRQHPAPGARMDEWVTQQLRVGWQRVTATVRVHAPLDAVQRWVAPAWGSAEEEAPNATIVRAGADTYDSIAGWLLLLQADLEVIEPDELRSAFAAVADRAQKAASGG